MTKAYGRFLAAIFCVFLVGLLAWHIVQPDRERSETENRRLAQTPEFSWETLVSGKFTKAVEEYFADQFPLRDQWTGLKARTEQTLGQREFHGVYLCGETLISKVAPPEDDQAAKNLSYVSRFAAAADVPVYLGLIPSAAEIWKEKLPAGAESWNQEAFLQEAAEIDGITGTIDFHTPLAAHKEELIFYRTDHHWTSLGAFYGANAVLAELNSLPLLAREDYTPETVSEAFHGTLYSTSGVHWLEPDTMEFWVKPDGLTVTSWRSGKAEASELYVRSYLEKKDKYSAFLGGNQPLCVIENENGQGKLLVIRDSYSDALAPFLAERFREVHLLDLRHYRLSAAEYVRENGIDAVAVVYSVPNFITDKNLVLLTR
ncbi:MAG: hypothetical protein HFF86_10745 [Oscillibacter sp.]|nr:hypothetical protein [Oscillibacter sp.]